LAVDHEAACAMFNHKIELRLIPFESVAITDPNVFDFVIAGIRDHVPDKGFQLIWLVFKVFHFFQLVFDGHFRFGLIGIIIIY
jgi:hypothetical protein